MEHQLWQKILDFDFDRGGGEYTFTLRLASENNWPYNFTQLALREYRKFMYLAATSSAMVSPSEIVDIVWHQHLIFTQSYREFCAILGKEIQHIPSTHNPAEAARFKAATALTTQLYNEAFGEQPKSVWMYRDILEPLHLEQSTVSIEKFLTFALPAVVLLLLPATALLQPLYVHINNPAFPICVCILAVIIFVSLKYYNERQLKQLLKDTDEQSVIHDLTPFELICMKRGGVEAVVNGCLGELMFEGLITLDNEQNFTAPEYRPISERHMNLALEIISDYNKISHGKLLRLLSEKPLFNNIAKSTAVITKHLKGAAKFARLFYLNFGLLAFLGVLIYCRVITGFLLDKDIFFILTIAFGYTALSFSHLKKLLQQPHSETLPSHYLEDKLTSQEINDDWQWLYLRKGPALLSIGLVTVAYPHYNENSSSNNDSSGSSCGSDGDGCGGGCGGCGGGD